MSSVAAASARPDAARGRTIDARHDPPLASGLGGDDRDVALRPAGRDLDVTRRPDQDATVLVLHGEPVGVDAVGHRQSGLVLAVPLHVRGGRPGPLKRRTTSPVLFTRSSDQFSASVLVCAARRICVVAFSPVGENASGSAWLLAKNPAKR